eukprot:COSAG01_NODE_1437_length_10311_cov_11.678613_9_plen_89_part_00
MCGVTRVHVCDRLFLSRNCEDMRPRDDEVEDEYGEIMGAFVEEAEKDVLSQVCARAVTPSTSMAHDGGWFHNIYHQKPIFKQASCPGR